MDLTQEQICDSLVTVAIKQDGFNEIMKIALDALMKAERVLEQKETGVSANGFRSRKIQGFGKEIVLSVPRMRSGAFYPVLLAVLRDEDVERQKLIFTLYKKGLTSIQIGDVYEEVYGKHYSKSQVSFLMKDAREEVGVWLERNLDEHYLAVYIDATFVSTRRDSSVKKEAYYSVLGVKTDGTREVLAVINHPTEGATQWKLEFEALKRRGVKSIGLVISDGLTSIENAVAQVFPNTPHQLCVFHFKKNISAVFPKKLKSQINEELKEVFLIESTGDKPLDGYNRLLKFIDTWENKYPSLKSYREERSVYYFTYSNYDANIQRMIYTTNWIERLNKDYKRTLKMRGALPNPLAVTFLMGAVAMEKTMGCYSYPIHQFKNSKQLGPKPINV